MPRKRKLQQVPVAPFRNEAIRQHEAGRTWADMARGMNYVRACSRASCGKRGDTSRVKRVLGIYGNTSCHWGKRYYYPPQEYITRATAKKLLDVLRLDPVDVGI